MILHALGLIFILFLSGTQAHCPNSPCQEYNHPHYVCGSNGKTYYNQCYLDKASCLASELGHSLTKAYDGQCRGGGGGGGGGHYQCRQCYNDRYQPVCGTDGRTYSSPCKLQQAACQTGRHIELRNYGVCNDYHGHHGSGGGGSGIGGVVGGIIGSAIGGATGGQHGHGGSSCNAYCAPGNRVCGSDGRVYGSRCELRKAACRNQGLREVDFNYCRGGGGFHGHDVHGQGDYHDHHFRSGLGPQEEEEEAVKYDGPGLLVDVVEVGGGEVEVGGGEVEEGGRFRGSIILTSLEDSSSSSSNESK